MGDPPHDLVIERLEALERGNRRLWYVGVGTIAAAIVFLAEGTTLLHPPRIVEAQGFVLKDSSGRVRGQLRMTPTGAPELSLIDEEGNDRVSLHTKHDHSSSLEFFGRGQPRVQLTASSDGTSLLQMADDDNGNQLALYMRGDGSTGQAFESRTRGLHVGVQPDGAAGLCVVDEQGIEHGRIGLLPDPVQCVRYPRSLDVLGPAPFRKRLTSATGSPSPLGTVDAQANRPDRVARAGRFTKTDPTYRTAH